MTYSIRISTERISSWFVYTFVRRLYVSYAVYAVLPKYDFYNANKMNEFWMKNIRKPTVSLSCVLLSIESIPTQTLYSANVKKTGLSTYNDR